jgi:hypothetical protein
LRKLAYRLNYIVDGLFCSAEDFRDWFLMSIAGKHGTGKY